jgi:4'-phosphopantetheinyl transferase
VHVWRASLDQGEAVVKDLEQTLSLEEMGRADRFHASVHRRDFVVGRGLARAILGRYLRVSPERFEFAHNAYGKPFLPDSPIKFNLSHAGRLALYAVARGREVGVDIERIRSDFDCEAIAERFFSERERGMLRALAPESRHRGFFYGWTRKEAFIKAIGQGVSFPLDQFDVALAPDTPAALLRIRGDAQAAAPWRVLDLDVADGYAAALVVEGPVQVQQWDWHPVH